MNGTDENEERPLAWTAVLADTPVEAADGTSIGNVEEVVGSRDDDIFHGIVVSAPGGAGHVLVPAEHVTSITDRRITVSLDPEQIRALPPYRAADSFELGFTGLLNRLGWVREGDEHS